MELFVRTTLRYCVGLIAGCAWLGTVPAWADIHSEPAPGCSPTNESRPLTSLQEGRFSSLRSRIAAEFTPKKMLGLKTLDEVREHILKTGSEKFVKGFDQARDKLEFAALAFEIPQAFLACLVYQESKFDSNAVSNSGARGMLQLNSMGRKEVLDILSKGEKNQGQGFLAELHDNWTNYHRLRLGEEQPSDRKLAQFRQDPGHLNGIGGGSVLLSFYLDRIKNDKKPLNRFDLLNAAAAYNLGITKATRLCNRLSSQACTEALARADTEARIHIKKIDECMSR